MRTRRDIAVLQRRIASAEAERDRHHATPGQDELFLQAYVVVKALELQLDEKRRETTRQTP